MDISVCMASYNGEKFLVEQINSILYQLNQDDELIIVDDCSEDNTVQIIKTINDYRIKFYANETNKGYVFSFSRAISIAKNDILFLSDQDDIWVKGRVELMKNKLLDTGLILISSNFEKLYMNGEFYKYPKCMLRTKDSSKHLRNISNIFCGRINYFGCGMAFRKELVDLILPIPKYVESHDLWIALAGNLLGSNLHIEEITITRRIHDMNMTDHNRHILSKLWTRILFLISTLSLIKRIIKLKIIRS